MTVTRRSFLYYMGPLALLPVLPRECSDLSDEYENSVTPFVHGVASGDPLPERVLLWTRVSGDAAAPARVKVSWRVARDAGFREVVDGGVVETTAEFDYTVKVDAVGLRPGTTYYYRFHALGFDSPIGRTKTAARKDVARLRLAFASCSNLPYGYFNAYAAIAQRADLDAVLHLGDYLYEYANGSYGDGSALGRIPEPNKEIVTLEEYRTRHAQYKTDPDLQEAHRQHPFIAVWDDHEVSNDAWRLGAENHQPEEGDFSERKAAAIKAYFEWMPVRGEQRDTSGKIYRSFQFGKLLDLFMLDTRLIGRDEQVENPCDGAALADPTRQLLGEAQESWFFAQLENSQWRGTRWRLVGQQVMFGQFMNVFAPGACIFNPDQWDGYAAARARVLNLLKSKPIDNVVILTGDIHSSWAMDICENPFDPSVYDASSGGGSLAVEFVTPAVTSPALEDPVQAAGVATALSATHPHLKFVDLYRRGYALLDVTRERVQCEWYHVATLSQRDASEVMARALLVRAGENHLVPATEATEPVASAPKLAPSLVPTA
ncbi:MAG: alkaline phosphatase D family protein [Polyangiaceae bacterium]